MTLFSKFNEAYEDLTHFSQSSPSEEGRAIFAVGAAAIDEGQRFFLPDAAEVLVDRVIDEDLKETLRLPFDCTAVLSNTRIEVTPGQWEASWKISVGIDVLGEFNSRHQLAGPDVVPDGSDGFLVLTIFRGGTLTNGRWVMIPAGVFCELPKGRPGYVLWPTRGGVFNEQQQHLQKIVGDFKDDAMALMNLCAMLSLKNVRDLSESPPERLNKRRVKNKKLPLYSYHILEVDGESWSSATSVGDGQRQQTSHMRRGHIRRLGDGRRTWVRATFVHGRAGGLIEKDYVVKP